MCPFWLLSCIHLEVFNCCLNKSPVLHFFPFPLAMSSTATNRVCLDINFSKIKGKYCIASYISLLIHYRKQ